MEKFAQKGRIGDAGVTLTEMLVVLAIIAIASGTTLLRLGSVGSNHKTVGLSTMVSDLSLNATDVLFSGQNRSLDWQANRYRLGTKADWINLPEGMVFENTGRHILRADGSTSPLNLVVLTSDGIVTLRFDGVKATLAASAVQP